MRLHSSSPPHIPIRYNHGRLVFRGQIKCFAPIPRKQYTVSLPRKGMLNQFAIYGRIVDRQNSELLRRRIYGLDFYRAR
jgi:hypothetical protein